MAEEKVDNDIIKIKKQIFDRSTMDWLKSRHFSNTKIQYLFTPDELEMHQAIASVFDKFDAGRSTISYNSVYLDGSGTLELNELYQMFKK